MRQPAFLSAVGGMVLGLCVLGSRLSTQGATPAAKPTAVPSAKASATPGGKPAVAPKVKEITWRTDLARAAVEAQKANRLMLVYVSGSDWDEYGVKLQKEVLKTKLFVDWVEKNAIPVNIDYPKDKPLNGTLKAQNAKFRTDYSVAKVPTFLFIDTSGEVIARGGFDTAKLRDTEKAGEPLAWMKFLDAVLSSRPPTENLNMQKTLQEGVASSRKHGVPLLIMLLQKPREPQIREKDAILKNQEFIRFVNRNMSFVVQTWPEDYDKTLEAEYARKFLSNWKIGPSELKFALWDPAGLGSLKDQFGGVLSTNLRPIIHRIDLLLPKIDYNGGWIEDWKMARAIAVQQKKDIFVAFVSSGKDEWSKLIDKDVFKTNEFRQYAHDNLVLLKADFPTNTGMKGFELVGQAATVSATTEPTTKPTTGKSPTEIKEMMVTGRTGEQPPQLKDQNKMLADMYGIQGYPTIVILNPLGQKIGDAKWMKGGIALFMKELDSLRKKDRERRTLISEQEAAK